MDLDDLDGSATGPKGEPEIAIIGMAGRFPGADDVDALWRNISTGVESFTRFSDEDLLASGEDPAEFTDPNYVRLRPILNDVRGWDAAFFGSSPREAMLADPQQRIFAECAWEVLEAAGYGVPDGRGAVGVFAGMNISTYLLTRPNAFRMGVEVAGLMVGNDKDALATAVSYRLDLRGPAVAVQTFCSTSLVAIHLACASVRRGECDIAIAGGVSIRVPDRVGYMYHEGNQASPDGKVRTFDAAAKGSMYGDGAAVVALKRLDRAVADRDTVLAVIRGSHINNDGALKFSFQAPSIDGQRRCAAAAIANSGVDPNEISYVEAHGTATEVGDPMEVAALTGAFGPTERKQYCLLGSVKPNIGHLDRASGATGLIKVVQSLRHELIPGTVHFNTPNPEIDFAASPFRVTPEPTPWPRRPDRPRIAGLSSLGTGGTNAHAIVSEAPEPAPRPARPRRWQVVPVSARSEAAADQACTRLADRLAADPGLDLGDVAFTLQTGRKVFSHRRLVVTDSTTEAARLIGDPSARLGRVDAVLGRRVGFLIAGVGEQYPGMVAELYRDEPGYRADVEECLAVLGIAEAGQLSDIFVEADGTRADAAPADDLARLLGRVPSEPGEPTARAENAHLIQPAVFVAEYALARQLIRWGVEPKIMIGYSLGEYVAACLSGVLSLSDALRLVAFRAKLITSLPEGAMLAVGCDEARLRSVLGSTLDDLDVAIRTGSQVVLAGPAEAVTAAATLLNGVGIGNRRLDTTHAFHSRMLLPVAEELTAWVKANVTVNPPTIPYLSNVTGRPVDAETLADPGYWARHMCQTVEFGAGLEEILRESDAAMVEIGPGRSLGAVTRAHHACDRNQWPLIVTSLPASAESRGTHAALTDMIGNLWLTGVPIDWRALHDGWKPGRVPLPTYPFQRQDYWLDPDAGDMLRPGGADTPAFDENDPSSVLTGLPLLPESQWINVPTWRQTTPRTARAEAGRWLVFAADDGRSDKLIAALVSSGAQALVARPGSAFATRPDGFVVRPGSVEDMTAALTDLAKRGLAPDHVLHLWTVGVSAEDEPAGAAPDAGGAIGAVRGDGIFGNVAGAAFGAVADAVRDVALDAFGSVVGAAVGAVRDTTFGAPGVGAPHTVSTRSFLKLGLHSVIAFAKAAGDVGLPAWTLDIVTDGSHRVLPDDGVRPEQVAVLGPCRLIPVEYPGVRTRLIDVEGGAVGRPALRALLAELRSEPDDQVVALRGGRRWIPGYEIIEESCIADLPPAAAIRPGGTYLVTGGLGGIGLAMAERLARDHRANLVLMGRTPVPPPDQWGQILASDATAPEVRRRIEGLRRIDSVVTVAGDVARPADVRRAVDTALAEFGRLDGVLHCAGVPAVGMMQFKTVADIEKVLAPKVSGTLALAEVLKTLPTPVDFVALFSSTTSSTGGGAGQVDYCTGNAFLDAFAESDPLPGTLVTSVDWGEWIWNGWTTGLDDYDEGSRQFFEQYRQTFGIPFDAGWETLQRVLASGERHVVVSTQDFTPIVAMSRRSSIQSHQDTVKKARDAFGRHPRPDLSAAYVEPQTPAEEAICDVWAEALGLEQVGVHDNFFELGGNSLIGMEIIARVRQALDVATLPPHLLYQAPTVSSLAAAAAAGHDQDEQDREAEARDLYRARIEQRRSSLRKGRV
ncbi:acyl transferase domain-containing protein/NAD(P)-dependent dehydrogenase (short-subunit alcohol dehydrogenase family) [Catenulispora sp. GAS73]|uniref:type I polyketide synthase n=1 Tax=Catenulispora sp. GAS73 TaxID=3156269 RepID=UPI003516FCD5